MPLTAQDHIADCYPAISQDRSLSVAYQAQHVGVTPDGQQQFRLSQIQPNSISKD